MDAIQTPGLLDILDFQYVAYGNAKWNGGNVTCQHGARECFGNMAENCAANLTAYNPLEYLPFVQCIETNCQQITPTVVNACCSKHKIDSAKLNACINGPLGKVLEEQAYKATPAHQWVPWMVLPNGTHFPGTAWITTPDIINAACDFWKGTKPACCTQNFTQNFQAEHQAEPCQNTDL